MKYIVYPNENIVFPAADDVVPHEGGIVREYLPLIRPVWNGSEIIEGATANELAAVLEAEKQNAEMAIDALEADYRNRIFGGSITGDRALEYVFSILEAAGILDNVNIPAVQGDAKTVLQKKAEKKGGGATESSEAAVALGKFLALAPIYGQTSGIRGKWKAAKNAATSISEIKQIVEQYKAEMEAYIAGLG